MVNTQNPTREAFTKLPSAIQDWLTSERVTEQIIRTNQRLDNFGKKALVIPSLLARLVTKNLDPRDFINELHKESGLSLIDAKLVTQELDQTILRPIRGQLKAAIDLDINLLYAWEPKSAFPTELTPRKISATEEGPITPSTIPAPSLPRPENPPIPKPIEPPALEKVEPLFRPAPLKPTPAQPTIPTTEQIKPSPIKPVRAEPPSITMPLAAPTPPPPTTPISPRTMEESRARPEFTERTKPIAGHPAPFILHEEKSEVKPTMESTPPTKTSLTFKIPFTTKKEAPKITHPPINVSLETPFESEDKNRMASTKPQENRVVHYSDLRTPVDPFTGQNQK